MSDGRALLLMQGKQSRRDSTSRLVSTLISQSSKHIDWKIVECSESMSSAKIDLRAMARSARYLPWLRQPPVGTARIVCAAYDLSPLALSLSRLARVKASALISDVPVATDQRSIRARAQSLAFSHFDRVVALSRHCQRELAKNGVAANPSTVVRPLMTSPWVSQTPPARRETGSKLNVVFLGELDSGHTNLEAILAALSVMRSNSVVGRLDVIGAGRRREYFELRTIQLEIDDIVAFHGGLNDEQAGKVLRNAHVGVFPSRASLTCRQSDSAAVNMTDLAGAGIPVITSLAAGAREAHQAAWSIGIDPDDVVAWVRAFENLHNDEDARLQMADAALLWGQQVDSAKTVDDLVNALWGEMT